MCSVCFTMISLVWKLIPSAPNSYTVLLFDGNYWWWRQKKKSERFFLLAYWYCALNNTKQDSKSGLKATLWWHQSSRTIVKQPCFKDFHQDVWINHDPRGPVKQLWWTCKNVRLNPNSVSHDKVCLAESPFFLRQRYSIEVVRWTDSSRHQASWIKVIS